MNVLVCVQGYPDNCGGVSLMYVHTRNLAYASAGIDVTVLNFGIENGYVYEGIKVVSYSEYETEQKKYDLLIMHAPNIRNHYRFLKQYGDLFAKRVFFFHGHEVLKINSVYSKPYFHIKRNRLNEIMQDVYDWYKLRKWRKYFIQTNNQNEYVFVSNWMYKQFLDCTKIPAEYVDLKKHIIYNNVGKIFETEVYDDQCKKEYDFITIRAFLDNSKYAVDIVNRIANNTPNAKFLVVGSGKIFDHFAKAQNIEWVDEYLNHERIIQLLNQAKYALMPTRTDAQGLMMCEMAAFGIPVITSDIPVCHEVFDGFENVQFIDNDDEQLDLANLLNKETHCIKDTRFYHDNTVNRELALIKQLEFKYCPDGQAGKNERGQSEQINATLE